MAKVISGTYGDALYDVAVEKHKEDELLSEATALLNVLDENPAFLSLMSHPEIIKEATENAQVIDLGDSDYALLSEEDVEKEIEEQKKKDKQKEDEHD